jgi:hypothetical protein
MATKKIRKKTTYELMNRCSLAQIVEMIEAEKRRKQRLEWYLQEVMLEKETLVNDPARLPWHSRCLILPSEPLPVTVTSLLKAPASLATASASHLPAFVFNTRPSSPSSTSSSPPFSPPLEASSGSSSPHASPAQSTSSSTSTSPLSSSWEGDWRHGSEEEQQRNFNHSDEDDTDHSAQLSREQWDPSELWWHDAFPDPLAQPSVAYECPF